MRLVEIDAVDTGPLQAVINGLRQVRLVKLQITVTNVR
jgi:hypothetical protein